MPSARIPQAAKVHLATLLMLLGLGCFAILSILWLSGNATLLAAAAALHQAQLAPPWFVSAPAEPWRPLWLGAIALLFVVIFAVMVAVPRPRSWARRVITGILTVAILRYVLWRVLATPNFAGPWDGIASLVLLLLEIPLTLTALPLIFWQPRQRDRSREADRYQTLVETAQYLPAVDVLIPTYNESERILRRTILGCQALDYPQKTIYVLDDGRREAIAQLARDLGCEYIARHDRCHAKAGNLNHALTKIRGELVAVFDADFIPTRNFLQRTVGFFDRADVGLVQTHQNYYNPDPIVRNLGLAAYMTTEREAFSRQTQLTLDSVGSTICDGSGFIVRRRSVELAGGFVTESLCEDLFTGIKLESNGQRVIYLDENLCAGLSAESFDAYIAQQQRWLNGSLQAFFIRANPLTLPGLKLRQRLGHLAHLSYWLTGFSRLFYLCIPMLWVLTRVLPLAFTANEFFDFLILTFLLRLVTTSWLSDRSDSAFVADIYGIIHAIPLSLTALQTLIVPFARGFRVTPKGLSATKPQLNLWLTAPLAVLWLGNALTLGLFVWSGLSGSEESRLLLSAIAPGNAGIWVFWWIYNLIFIGLAILGCIDAARLETYEWLGLQKPVAIRQGDRAIAGTTLLASESGLRVRVDDWQDLDLEAAADLEVEIQCDEWPGPLTLAGRALPGQEAAIEIRFAPLSDSQHRHLVELLFCRPGQWLRRQHPNDLQMPALLARQILRPRFTQRDEIALDAIPTRSALLPGMLGEAASDALPGGDLRPTAQQS